ncbi:MAG: GNAT family N-acetyltransferase [Methanobacteriota archaeon]|nr:MAG: GNAT family N-acetyltransferase [Euryarchaeota archaeon]
MHDNDSTTIVRAATREDIPGIVTVMKSSVTEEEVVGFGGMNSESPFRDAMALSVAWLDPNRVGPEELFVAQASGRVVGVVAMEERDLELEIVDIDVARAHQRKGIGKSLVQFIEGRARVLGKRAVTLGTSRNAEGVPWKSLPFWQALGYAITHEEENAWTLSIGPGAREIRMRKEL